MSPRDERRPRAVTERCCSANAAAIVGRGSVVSPLAPEPAGRGLQAPFVLALLAICLVVPFLIPEPVAAVSADACESRALGAAGYGKAAAKDTAALVDACKAIVAGEYEMAVGILQGLLLTAGDRPFVLLRLSELYADMGAGETARYFRTRAELAARRNPAMAEESAGVEQDRTATTATDPWNGVVQFGVRYQSNPALAPESNEIEAGGLRFRLPESLSDAADWNAEIVSRIRHRFDLQSQYAWVSDGSLYGAFYSQQDQLDFALAEVTTGLEYASARREFTGYTLRPHLVGLLSYFDDGVYEETTGLGLDFDYRFGQRTAVKTTYQYRVRDFADTGAGSTSADRSGGEHRLAVGLLKGLPYGRFLGVGLLARDVDADRDVYAYQELEGNVRVSFGVRNPLFRDEAPMTLTPYVVVRRTAYDGSVLGRAGAPDQTDNQVRVGLLNRVPFASSWALQLRLEYAEIDSDVELYDVRNELATLSIEKRF
jgi:hypothetical protein